MEDLFENTSALREARAVRRISEKARPKTVRTNESHGAMDGDVVDRKRRVGSAAQNRRTIRGTV